MKYYVYAGYYENFISGHKLPKPYTLRDEFKTFDEALDYVLENWEDDAIFFTEDVIGDAIDNGFINDEDWENYLMEESKKSMKEFNEDINNTAYFDRVAGELHSWYVCYVEDYERKYEYGFKNEKECINWIKKNGFDLDPSMIESKKSARKSIEESLNFKKDYVVEVMGGTYWFKPFYWDFDEFRNDLLVASEEEEFTYYITEASTTDYRINFESNDGFYERYDVTFRIIPKSDKATAKELNNYLN